MQFKLLVLGDHHVGKTSLLTRFWDDRFTEVYRTPADFRYKYVKLEDAAIKLQMVSFDNVASWLEEAKTFVGDNVAKLLVGSKLDLSSQRQVSHELATECASQNDIQYIETSAKTGQNVEQAFMALVAEVKDKYDAGIFTTADPQDC